jgi:hypothetical protein
MAGSGGDHGFAANSMLPGEAERQSAPAACPPSTLYSIEYHVQKIENADAAGRPGVDERNAMDLMVADRLAQGCGSWRQAYCDVAGIDGVDG